MFRYEHKFVLPFPHLAQFTAWLRLHPEGFITAYPDRTVTSGYYDQQGLSDFSDNLAGAGNRTKLRLRWYGSGSDLVQATLELKKRDYNTISKQTAAFPDFDSTRQWTTITEEIRGEIRPNWAPYWQQPITPTLITRYKRRYLTTPDKQLRLTIDTHLQAFDQRQSATPQFDRNTLKDNNVVIELKTDTSNYPRLQAIASTLPIRRVRHSKYTNGLAAGYL